MSESTTILNIDFGQSMTKIAPIYTAAQTKLPIGISLYLSKHTVYKSYNC